MSQLQTIVSSFIFSISESIRSPSEKVIVLPQNEHSAKSLSPICTSAPQFGQFIIRLRSLSAVISELFRMLCLNSLYSPSQASQLYDRTVAYLCVIVYMLNGNKPPIIFGKGNDIAAVRAIHHHTP